MSMSLMFEMRLVDQIEVDDDDSMMCLVFRDEPSEAKLTIPKVYAQMLADDAERPAIITIKGGGR